MSIESRPETSTRKDSRPPGHPTLSVVVPLYNEQEVVPELVHRVVHTCRSLSLPFELVVVNDGSRDHTLPLLVKLSQEVPEMKVVNLFRNFGHMAALSAGIALAKGNAVLVMDGDLQDPPELIPRFLTEWQRGVDVVYGLRTSRRESAPKRMAISLFYWLMTRTAEARIPRQVGTFSLLDRQVVDILNRMPERDRFFAGLRAWIGGKQSFVEYDRPDRDRGRSRVGIRGMSRLARTALISFSKVPLRYASLFSLLCGLVLFSVGTVSILVRLFTDLAIPGWATYTTLIGMMGFAQSIVLAVISEYVAVIFDEIKARPAFLVREVFTQGEIVQKGE